MNSSKLSLANPVSFSFEDVRNCCIDLYKLQAATKSIGWNTFGVMANDIVKTVGEKTWSAQSIQANFRERQPGVISKNTASEERVVACFKACESAVMWRTELDPEVKSKDLPDELARFVLRLALSQASPQYVVLLCKQDRDQLTRYKEWRDNAPQEIGEYTLPNREKWLPLLRYEIEINGRKVHQYKAKVEVDWAGVSDFSGT